MKPSDFWNDGRTEREFEESGLQCCTRTIDMGHRCGYVALPKGHPLFGKDWDACYDVAPELDVDGGITFANGTDDTWILGWDAAHCWHRPDPSIMSDNHRAIYERIGSFHDEFAVMVDADMAEQETRRFARQLAVLREGGERMSEKHYPCAGGEFDRIVFDGDGSVWTRERTCKNVYEGSDIDRYMMFKCSNCGCVLANHYYPKGWIEQEHTDDEFFAYDGERLNYCPNCGAKVIGG